MPTDRAGHRSRSGKGTTPGRYSFLTQRLLPREEIGLLSRSQAHTLAAKAEKYLGIKTPKGLSPLGTARNIFAKSDLTVSFVKDKEKLHLMYHKTLASLEDFCVMPIDFTYRLSEPFASLARRALSTFARVTGMSDCRDSYYFDMLTDITHDNLNQQDYEEDDDEYWPELQQQIDELIKGDIASRLDSFLALPPVDFNELRSIVPAENEKKLHEVLLKMEDVLKDCPNLKKYFKGAPGDENIIPLEWVYCFIWSTDRTELIDQIDESINNDVECDCCPTNISVDVEVGKRYDDTFEKKIAQVVNYYTELIQTIQCLQKT